MTETKKKPANKSHLVRYVADQIDLAAHDLTIEDLGTIFDMFLQGIVQHATDHPRLQLRDFGNFEMRDRKQRSNPHPVNGGPPTVIPGRQVLWFTASRGTAKVSP